MIAVLSSSPREAAALLTLASASGRPTTQCGSISRFKSLVRKVPPVLVLTRHKLSDGYSDDVLAWLGQLSLLPSTSVIVLAKADCDASQEARQLNLGAACVLRDPLRPDVLVQYAHRFLRAARTSATPDACFAIAGATINPDQHQVRKGKLSAHLSPKEVDLARVLAETPGQLVSYDKLYVEICGRKFDGNTANIRVLFGKLVASFQRVRVDLHKVVHLTPKSGYRYVPVDAAKA